MIQTTCSKSSSGFDFLDACSKVIHSFSVSIYVDLKRNSLCFVSLLLMSSRLHLLWAYACFASAKIVDQLFRGNGNSPSPVCKCVQMYVTEAGRRLCSFQLSSCSDVFSLKSVSVCVQNKDYITKVLLPLSLAKIVYYTYLTLNIDFELHFETAHAWMSMALNDNYPHCTSSSLFSSVLTAVKWASMIWKIPPSWPFFVGKKTL